MRFVLMKELRDKEMGERTLRVLMQRWLTVSWCEFNWNMNSIWIFWCHRLTFLQVKVIKRVHFCTPHTRCNMRRQRQKVYCFDALLFGWKLKMKNGNEREMRTESCTFLLNNSSSSFPAFAKGRDSIMNVLVVIHLDAQSTFTVYTCISRSGNLLECTWLHIEFLLLFFLDFNFSLCLFGV